jgi:sensor c-di-GMP phosphodiesterase-like protein
MDIIINIIIALVCGLVPTLLTLWLNEKVKGSVQNHFNKSLEEVKKEHSKELAQFQMELNNLKSKENFKFTKLHEKRLEVLEKTYYYINETSELLKFYVIPLNLASAGKTKKMLREDFVKSIDQFEMHFKYNSIYFDETIEKLLIDFFNQSVLIFATYGKNEPVDDNLHSIKEFNKNLAPIKKQIEIKFRELLGE